MCYTGSRRKLDLAKKRVIPIEERKVIPIEEKSFFSKLGDVLKNIALGLGDGIVKVLVVLAVCFLASMILFR